MPVESEKTPDTRKLLVFISYSRKDSDFADWLAAELEKNYIHTIIDKRDLPYGEKWQKQLSEFISSSDGVVFITSRNSIRSNWCQWELTQTRDQSKRLIPILRDAIPPEDLPAQIAEINLLPFTPDVDRAESIVKLVKAIFQDQEWIREHSRLGSLAAAWGESQQNEDRLLRGKALLAADHWIAQRPPEAPAPSRDQLAFINASHVAAKMRSHRLIGLMLLAVVLALGLAGFAEWERRKAVAERNDANILRLLSESSELLHSNTPKLLQGLQMLTAAHRLAQNASSRVQSRSYGLLQQQTDDLKLLSWFQDFDLPSNALAVSSDGSRIVSGNNDRTLRIRDAVTGKPIGQPLTGHDMEITSVAFNPVDNSRIVSGSGDRTLRLWDTHSSVSTSKNLIGHKYSVLCVAFSPKGDYIVSGGTDGELIIWDASSGKLINRLFDKDSPVRSVVFSTDGARIVSGSDDGVRFWDAKSGKVIYQIKLSDEVRSVAYSSTDSRIAAGTKDNHVYILDGNSGKIIGQPLKGHSDSVSTVAFNKNGTIIASGSWDRSIRLWDAHSGQSIAHPINTDSAVNEISFVNDLFITSSGEQGIRMWSIPTAQAISSPLNKGLIIRVAFSSDRTRMVCVSSEGLVYLWDTISLKLIDKPWHADDTQIIAFSPDGSRIVSGDGRGNLRFFDGKSGAIIGNNVEGHIGKIHGIAFHPHESQMVSIGYDGIMRQWNWRNDEPQPIGKPIDLESPLNDSVAYSPDGSRIAVAGWKFLRIFNTKPLGAPKIIELQPDKFIRNITFSPDGSRIVAGSETGAFRYFDGHSGKPIGNPIKYPDEDTVENISFSPDGFNISTSREGYNTISLWDINSGLRVGQRLVDELPIVGSTFSADGSYIISKNTDPNTPPRQWPVLNELVRKMCDKLPRNMSHKEWRDWVSPDIDYIDQCPGKPTPDD